MFEKFMLPQTKKTNNYGNNSKVSKATILENYFVEKFSDKKYGILEMQVSIYFFDIFFQKSKLILIFFFKKNFQGNIL